MADKSVPFIVRRARLLTGMTQSEFAMLYGVDEATVSQWETRSAQPSPEIWSRLRNVSLQASSALDEALVRVSPVCKGIAHMDDLTHPIAVSKGIKEAIEAVGASKIKDQPLDVVELARNSLDYGSSGLRALEIVQADSRWLRGDIVYAEFHCISVVLGVWVDAMVAPLPDRLAAIIEFAPSKRRAAEGFWVRLVQLQDMSPTRIS